MLAVTNHWLAFFYFDI